MSAFTVAVFADVHGNYRALAACLAMAEAKAAGQYLFLGDYVTDHPYPQRVLALLREAARRHPCLFVRGNREEYMIAYRKKPAGWRDGSAQGALLYCYENLAGEDIDWFESLPIYDVWRPKRMPPIAICHGSPTEVRGTMREGGQELETMPAGLLLKGHNHRRISFCWQGRRVICAGSVGNPIYCRARPGRVETTPLAKQGEMLFLHLREGRWVPEFLPVPYDWQGALDDLTASGLNQRAPVWSALLRYNVLTGADPCGAVPSYAAELYRQETGLQAPWPQVPEVYWQQAALAFGVELW